MSLKGDEIVIVCQYSADIGLGHLSRCLYLKHYLGNEIRTKIYVVANDLDVIPSFSPGELQFEVFSGEQELIKWLLNMSVRIAIIDTFNHFVELHDFLSVETEVIFYLGRPSAMANGNTYVVNVAEGNKPESSHPNPNLFQGMGYFIPNPKLPNLKTKSEYAQKPKKILCVFGGTDASFLSNIVYNYVYKANIDAHFTIVSNRLFHQYGSTQNTKATIDVVGFIPEIIEKLSQYDLMITSPGNLYFEGLCLKVPTVAITQNEKQKNDFKMYPLVFSPEELENILARLNQYYELAKDFAKSDLEKPGDKIIEIIEELKKILKQDYRYP